MSYKNWQERILNALRLVACIPLQRGRPVHTFHPLLGQHLPVLEREARKMWEEGSVRQISLTAETEPFQGYLIPTDEERGFLLAFDTSAVKTYTQRYHESLVQAYRDVIYAVTEGRLLLVDPAEVSEHIGEPISAVSHSIRTPADIGRCRNLVNLVMGDAGMSKKYVMEFSLATSEAVTNVLKHASGGEFRLIRTPRDWTAVIVDTGPGIDITLLPHATLLRGYSTKPSLGLGFTAMLRCLDTVVVATASTGTTLLLQKFHSDRPDHGGKADER